MSTDKTTIHIVTAALGLIVLGALGVLAFALSSGTLDSAQKGQALTALSLIGTGALGALAGLLAHTGSPDAGGGAVAAPAAPVVAPNAHPAGTHFDGTNWVTNTGANA